jgi:hypothetical protein
MSKQENTKKQEELEELKELEFILKIHQLMDQ